jgi:hypothetical protein
MQKPNLPAIGIERLIDSIHCYVERIITRTRGVMRVEPVSELCAVYSLNYVPDVWRWMIDAP